MEIRRNINNNGTKTSCIDHIGEYLREHQTPLILQIHPHLFGGEIVSRLNLADRIRMTSVCKSWRGLLVDFPRPIRFPWLMLADPDYRVCRDNHLRFYTMPDDDVIDWNLHNPRFCGCSYVGFRGGWFLFATKSYKCFLLNLVSGVSFALPPVTKIPNFENAKKNTRSSFVGVNPCLSFVKKIAVSSCHDDVVVAAIFHSTRVEDKHILAVCKPNDKERTIVSADYSRRNFFTDLIFYDGCFYINAAVELHIRVASGYSISLTGRIEARFVFVFNERFSWFMDDSNSVVVAEHFVKSFRDELLLVVRCAKYGLKYQKTTKFEVYKLGEHKKWEKLTSLGDQAILLSNGDSYSVPTRDLHSAFQSNCIYFALNINIVNDLVGVFFMDDGRIENSIPGIDFQINTPTCWFLPS